ncbi:SMI1/KNR4 family protein [Phenylobacterium sp.]|uniref:SMI1/KNR4 family protein n=1 Tax=Phenylobacterium sp. TaxID=1871053 RepID=UPI00391BA640
MSIENLVRAVPPPARPVEAFEGPWEPIEAELGTSLPSDYKDFVRLYGNGYFMEFMGVCVPRSRNPYVRLETQAKVVGDLFRSMDLDEHPYRFWPEPGGLLSFGGTDYGDALFWLPHGRPETWRVVVWGRGLQEFEAFGCDLTDFLAGLATGQILPEDFPGNILPCDLLFQAHSG